MPDREDNLRLATPQEVADGLAFALRFKGRKRFRPSGEYMAEITAAWLVDYLLSAGFVVMKKPPMPLAVSRKREADG